MTTFLTKAQRQILIDWYIDCLIETESEFVDGSEEAERQSLASMNNSYFYEYVQEMMPNCMQDLAKMKQEVTVQELSQGGLQDSPNPVILHSWLREAVPNYSDNQKRRHDVRVKTFTALNYITFVLKQFTK